MQMTSKFIVFACFSIFLIPLAMAEGFSVEFSRIEFRSSLPSFNDSIKNSVNDFNKAENDLKNIADSLKKIDKVGAEIIGFTDKSECLGSECFKLSLRRAEMIYSWLVKHDVPTSRLRGPTAGGSDWPIGDNNKASGKKINRRVQFDLFLIK